jgi:phospholipase/carboxylesterase
MELNKILTAGKKLSESKKVLLMIHGRGGSAEDILSIAEHLSVNDFSLLAPQAPSNSWYPQSFLAPPSANEPYLSDALNTLDNLVANLTTSGIAKEDIYFLGFSQGACLTLEYVSRHAAKYGGIIAFTGGLIGDKIYSSNYSGDFNHTPIFLGSSDPDAHVPVERVESTAGILKDMHATVTLRIYKNMAHTISQAEINEVNELIFRP